MHLFFLFLARLKRHVMSDKDLENVRDKVPGLKKGTSQLFRSLRDKGIISYTEYLFLLSVLTSECKAKNNFSTRTTDLNVKPFLIDRTAERIPYSI